MTDAELRKIERSAHPDSMLGLELAPLIAEIRRCWAIIEHLRNLFPRDVDHAEEANSAPNPEPPEEDRDLTPTA